LLNIVHFPFDITTLMALHCLISHNVAMSDCTWSVSVNSYLRSCC